MSFGGHVQDMLNRIKQNASLKNGRCNKFKGGNNYSKTQSIKTGYDFPKLAKVFRFSARGLSSVTEKFRNSHMIKRL